LIRDPGRWSLKLAAPEATCTFVLPPRRTAQGAERDRTGREQRIREVVLEIRIDDLAAPEVVALLQEHLHDMTRHSPPESIHALDLERLRSPDITFWSVWDGLELLGFGALKRLDGGHAEIKSMRTASRHRGRGVADRLLQHMLDEARRRGYRRVSLETGSMAAFEPARRLYEKHGFTTCAPFADYAEDPNSVFMTRELCGDGFVR
jgi:putative acetyltransferase